MAKYSYWLYFNDELQEELQTIVEDLAEKYHAPIFDPHLTIVADIETSESDAIAKAKLVAQHLQKTSIQLSEVSFSTTYFQCVFARVKANAAITKAYLQTLNLFNKSNTFYMPHVSLLYGDFEMEIREKIASEIKLKIASGMLNKLIVLHSSPNPKDWQTVAELPLL